MFVPDYKNIVDCALNKKPARTPLYEHGIAPEIMEKMGQEGILRDLEQGDLSSYFRKYCAFFLDHGYDTVTFEGCVTEILPHGGALAHPRPGYIDGREKFESYPWDSVADLYFQKFSPVFSALAAQMPQGMKAIGGVGNGVFEIAQDLVGYETLCVLKYDDEQLFADIFERCGSLLYTIWERFLNQFADVYCVCRFGDDLGYKSNTLLSPDDIRTFILPQYEKIVKLIHSYRKPFLLHSCGNIFSVMEDIIGKVGIDAKHSNEDQIAPMSEWVEKYGARIGNFGGIDTDHLVRMELKDLETETQRIYALAQAKQGGFAIGSGNSIAWYVDPQRYLKMVNTVRLLRGDEIHE